MAFLLLKNCFKNPEKSSLLLVLCMKNKRNLLLLSAILLAGCTSKKLDLSTISYNENAGSYLDGLKYYKKTDQQGHYAIKGDGEDVSLVLKDDGERLVNYVFMEGTAKEVNYAGLPISEVLGAAVSVYEDKVAYFHAVVQPDHSVELFESMKKSLGQPTEIINDTVQFDKAHPTPAQSELLKKLPDLTKPVTDEELGDERLSYPQRIIWLKGEVIHMLTLEAVDAKVSNQIMAITKKAFKDRVIVGFHVPEQDPILGKYLK